MSLSTSPRRRLRASFLALAATAIASLAIASSASAAAATGEVTLTLKKGAQSSLLRQGVKVAPSSGGGKAKTVKLAVTDLDLASGAVRTGAALTFRANGKSVRLNDLLVSVGATSTAVTGRHGGKEKVVFRLKGSSQASASSLGVSGRLALTGTGLKLLRQGLELPSLKGGRVGSAALTATLPPVKIDDGGLKPDQPKGETDPYAAQCPVSPVSGGPGGAGTLPGKVSGIAAAPTFSPGTEQSVTGTELDWGFYGGFRGYVLGAPPPGTLQPLDGAEAVGSNMAAATSYFKFPATGGSYEAGTANDHSDDKLVVNGTGTVLFCKSGHGFDVVLKNPTVTIDGDSSRITADVGADFNGTWYPFQRVDVADLDLSGVTPKFDKGGNTATWEEIPATLTADGAKASGLGGFYPAGTEIDPITVKTSLDRPLTQQCTLAAGTVETPPTVDFTLPALPTLSNPVTGTGGTINWGFRRSSRATTVSGAEPAANAFQLLGGATESYPGNMGGAAGAPPTGGTGKFFRFPISSYEYEVGTSDPGDDRLVATSDATVGFCNVKFGGFGIVLSKPTLVIDGEDSRLVANAYSYAGPFGMGAAKGWIGGRVTLVELDTSAIDAVTGSGNVSWGEVLPNETPMANGIPVDLTGGKGLRTEALSLASLTESSTSAAGGFDPLAAQIVLPAP